MLTVQDFRKHTDQDAFMRVLEEKIPKHRIDEIMSTVKYEKELLQLQAELVDLQQWVAKHQKITARSSTEAEIYATDECVRDVIYLSQIIADILMDSPTTIYNDNMACVLWSKNRTTRSIRHIQIRENAVHEAVQNKTADVKHVARIDNLADIFTKEDKDNTHFIRIRDSILSRPLDETLSPTAATA